MINELVVSNSSPLIALAQIGQLSLLESLFGSVTVPVAVVHEISPTIKETPPWIKVVQVNVQTGKTVLRTSLGVGESEAICLALELGASHVLVDDRPARRMASAMGLNVMGTLGLVLAGKKKGKLTAVRPMLDQLAEHGFWASPHLYARVLSDAGESSQQE